MEDMIRTTNLRYNVIAKSGFEAIENADSSSAETLRQGESEHGKCRAPSDPGSLLYQITFQNQKLKTNCRC